MFPEPLRCVSMFATVGRSDLIAIGVRLPSPKSTLIVTGEASVAPITPIDILTGAPAEPRLVNSTALISLPKFSAVLMLKFSVRIG